MSIDGRVNDLISKLPYLNKTEGGVEGFREQLRLALLEVARDQRHACAESVITLELRGHEINRAHQAVMNATIE